MNDFQTNTIKPPEQPSGFFLKSVYKQRINKYIGIIRHKKDWQPTKLPAFAELPAYTNQPNKQKEWKSNTLPYIPKTTNTEPSDLKQIHSLLIKFI